MSPIFLFIFYYVPVNKSSTTVKKGMTKMQQIVDDVYTNIREDIEKVQAKPTMYISYTGARAALHLAKEIINNAIDEFLNPNSISDGTIEIHYDQSENMLFVSDTGRGIPFEELENACTILHSGTKMLREHLNTAGENGGIMPL